MAKTQAVFPMTHNINIQKYNAHDTYSKESFNPKMSIENTSRSIQNKTPITENSHAFKQQLNVEMDKLE